MGVMEDRRRILMATDGFVPPEYQRYDYLEKTASSTRIDTGVSGNDSSLRFVFDFAVTAWANYGGLFGNYTDENTRCWRIISMASTATYYKRGLYSTMQNNRAGASSSFSISDTDGTNKRTHIDMSYGRIIVQNDERDYDLRPTADTSYQPSTRAIAIGSNQPGGGSALLAKFYDFKIYQGSRLIRNYIPVVRKSDNKAGFYDAVNCTFNPSIGTEQFVAGND